MDTSLQKTVIVGKSVLLQVLTVRLSASGAISSEVLLQLCSRGREKNNTKYSLLPILLHFLCKDYHLD